MSNTQSPPVPSARPPSSPSRRLPDLDSPEARAFVSGADRGGEGATPAAAPAVTLAAPLPVAQAPAAPAPLLSTSYRPAATKEGLKPLTLRIPESLHAELALIAENTPRSMNQFAIDVLRAAAATEIDKIRRRRELGLD